MVIIRKVISVVAAVALAVSFVGAGFLVCTVAPVTHVLANVFSDDVTSPFSRSQLVQVADATRDYAFGSHGKTALYQAIYDVDLQYRASIEKDGGSVPSGFPRLDAVTDRDDLGQLEEAFSGASELYCYSVETIAHLDDCNAIARVAYPLLAVAAAIGVACLAFTGVLGGKRRAGNVLLAAGIVVLAAFIGIGLWAIFDFSGLFTSFHRLFFAQGNWQFPYDSLLICALPTDFWIGMVAVWVAVAALVSILSIVISAKLRR